MPNRTFDEIKEDVDHAMRSNDAEALLRYATELDAIDTSQAAALSGRSRGVALYLRGDYTAAMSQYLRALALHDELGERSGVARVTGSIGSVHKSTGDYPEALSHYLRALALHDELGDRSGVAGVINNIGLVHQSTGDYPEALSHFLRALALYDELGNRSGVARVTGNIGLVHKSTGDYPEALRHYLRALALHDELGERSGVAIVTSNIGNVHQSTGDYPEALSHYLRALALYDELGERSGVASVTGNIGNVHQSTGDYPEALSHYLRALALYDELGERSGVASVTGNIGNVHLSTGDYPEALSHFQRALALYEELGNRSGVAGVTGNIGIVHISTGDYPEALSHYHRALALFEELGNRSGVAMATGNIGNVHKSTGDYPEALSHFLRALALHDELGDRSGVARVTGNIGIVHGSTGDYPEALTHFHRALALHEELGERSGVAGVTGNIVAVYVEMGSDTEAQQLLETMDDMHIDEPGVRITREQLRATLQERSGDLDAAASTLQQTLSEALEHGLRSYAADTHKALRDLALKQNNLAGYVEHNNEFLRITEEVNGKDTATKLAMQAKQREIDAVQREHAQHMAVLHSTLPKHIADRVARGETVNDHYDNAAVIFLDIVGFTTISDRIPSGHVVHLLEQIFTTLDAVCEKHIVVKIKTIGDSYMAVSFESIENAASCALDMLASLDALVITMPPALGDTSWTKDVGDIKVRIGIHCGPVTAGVIGTARMQYDVWGDTVNVASRMESTSEPGRIHVSSSFALALALNGETANGEENGEMAKWRNGKINVVPRGTVDVKGKGAMQTYWLE